mgnify:CR=1 FL=1
MDRIFLCGMRFMACHGVLPHEREIPQPFEADVELGLDLRAAGESDNIEDTVNYAKVYDIELDPSHEQDKAATYTVTLESNQTFKQVSVDGETAAVTEIQDQEKGHHGPADHQEGQAQGPGQEGDRGQHQGPNQNQAGPGSDQGPNKQEGGPQGQGAPAQSNKR